MNSNEVVALAIVAGVVLLILRPGSLNVSWRAGNKAGRLNYKPEQGERQNSLRKDRDKVA